MWNFLRRVLSPVFHIFFFIHFASVHAVTIPIIFKTIPTKKGARTLNLIYTPSASQQQHRKREVHGLRMVIRTQPPLYLHKPRPRLKLRLLSQTPLQLLIPSPTQSVLFISHHIPLQFQLLIADCIIK